MAIDKIRTLVENCYLGGSNCISSFRKTPAIASTQSGVVDLSMAPGNPRPNYYTGDALTATLFNGSYGVWTGGDVSPKTKVLRKVDFMLPPATITPIQFYVLDFLMFYPLIDMDSTDEQIMTNTVSLPRYTDGNNVKMFVVATNPYLGGASYTINYVNQNGERKSTRLQTSNSHTYIGTVIHSGNNANVSGTFVSLPDGDGVRYVESITFTGPNGGLAAIVLCKVLTTVTSVSIAPSQCEWDCLLQKGELPVIKDGAYINFITQVNGSAAAVIIAGTIETVWN